MQRSPRVDHSDCSRLHSVVPAFLRWQGYGRTYFNLLVFGLTALAASWIVHQTEYTIEYGSRVGTVMQTTPHRFYMAPLGLVLAGLGIALALLLSLSLRRTQRTLARLAGYLPPRLARRLHWNSPNLSARAIAVTALCLAGCQLLLYSLQENLEALALTGTLPGPAVLFAPQHITVVPLHLLAALLSSCLLWLAAGRLNTGRHVAGLARTLARIAELQRPRPSRARASALRCRPGRWELMAHALRAPPLI